MVIDLPERDNAQYTANYRYVLKDSYTGDVNGLRTGSYESFDSVCTETMVGMKLTQSGFTQCWYGQQDKPLNTEQAEENDLASAKILA